MTEEDKKKIIELKEKIHDNTEYLNSDLCSICGNIALELEKHIKELSDIIEKYGNNS